MDGKMKFNVVQCWTRGCKTLGEAMNNPRGLRFTGFPDEESANRYLQRCKDKKEEDFYYFKESI